MPTSIRVRAARLLQGVAVLAVALLAGPVQAARVLEPDDVFRIADVSDVQIAPDGRSVAYLVSTNLRESDEPVTALWCVDWDGGEPLQLTRSLKDVASPRWSPDGRWLSFLATPAGTERSQLMLIDRRGGEPQALTHAPGVIAEYAWAPDGRRLVIQMQQAEPAPQVAKTPRPIVIDALRFKGDEEGYLTADTAQHLYLVDAKSGELERLTGDDANESAPAWSTDGKRLAYVRTRERGMDADGMEDIMAVEAAVGATPRTLVRVNAPNHQQLRWTPDGQSLALAVGAPIRLTAYGLDVLALVPVAGGEVRKLSDTLDRAVVAYSLSADGRFADVIVEDDTRLYPSRVPLAGGAIERVWRGEEVLMAQSIGAGHTAVLASNDRSPFEVYALDKGRLRRLTHHNDALMAELSLGVVEDLRFAGRDGVEVHGLLVKPPGFVPGHRYPTILWIHGGPNGQDEHSLTFSRYALQLERQMLAGQGYLVLGINYRGGTGRGFKFSSTIAADWGHKEVEDLSAAVDAVIASGLADPERLGVGGWSYGGILTDYLIASEPRWKAAVSGAGSANQISMYGMDQYVHQYNAELGLPWVNTALWLKVSYPFFHADRIHTPTLFLGGEKDFNVPIAGGEQMYQALRTLGVPTRLVVYPEQFHIFTRPSYIKDRSERVRAWYARYLQPEAVTR